MVGNDLLTHPKWQSFTSRPIPSSDSSEVMLALNCDSQQEVDRLTDAAGRNGGIADVNPVQDLGFMYSRSYTDLDGHLWEVLWMDPAVASGEAEVPPVDPAA